MNGDRRAHRKFRVGVMADVKWPWHDLEGASRAMHMRFGMGMDRYKMEELIRLEREATKAMDAWVAHNNNMPTDGCDWTDEDNRISDALMYRYMRIALALRRFNAEQWAYWDRNACRLDHAKSCHECQKCAGEQTVCDITRCDGNCKDCVNYEIKLKIVEAVIRDLILIDAGQVVLKYNLTISAEELLDKVNEIVKPENQRYLNRYIHIDLMEHVAKLQYK